MANNLLIAVGDSLTAGDTLGAAPYTGALSLTHGTFDISNIGIDSEQLLTMAANAPFNVAPLSRRGVENVCIVWGGTNDEANIGLTAAQIYAQLVIFCAAIRSAGWRIIITTAIDRGGSQVGTGTPNWQVLAAYNTLIYAGWNSIADGLSDLAGVSYLTPNGTNNLDVTHYASDGIHLLAATQQGIVATTMSAAVNLIATPAVVPQVKTVYGGSIGSAASAAGSPIAVDTGDLIVVGVRWFGSTTVTGVTDTAGNSYSALTTVHNGTAVSEQLWYAKNSTKNNANTITAAFAGAVAANGIFIWATSGVDTASPLDQQATGTGSAATVTSAAFTTTQANEVIFAFSGIGSDGPTYVAQSGYTLDLAAGPLGHAYMGAQHLIVNAIQTAATSAMTASSSGTQAIAVATFKLNATISGSAGIGGATVSYSGTASGSVTADVSGNYLISNLENGSYTITPSLSGYVFTPTNSAKTIAGANLSGVNFTAAPAGDSYDSTKPYLGTVTVVSGAPAGLANPFVGKMLVLVAAPGGFPNAPYLGRIIEGSAPSSGPDVLLGQVAVVVSAPSGVPDPFLGTVDKE